MGTPHPNDEHWMRHALNLAWKGQYSTTPNPRVGCVFVRDGVAIAEGFHVRAGEGHAEVQAIAQARAQGVSLQGSTAYVTLEPCAHHGRTGPCAEALVATGVARVVAAMQADLLFRLAQGGVDRRGVGLFHPPAGEADLAGVVVEVVGAFGEEDGGCVLAHDEREQHRSRGRRLVCCGLVFTFAATGERNGNGQQTGGGQGHTNHGEHPASVVDGVRAGAQKLRHNAKDLHFV